MVYQDSDCGNIHTLQTNLWVLLWLHSFRGHVPGTFHWWFHYIFWDIKHLVGSLHTNMVALTLLGRAVIFQHFIWCKPIQAWSQPEQAYSCQESQTCVLWRLFGAVWCKRCYLATTSYCNEQDYHIHAELWSGHVCWMPTALYGVFLVLFCYPLRLLRSLFPDLNHSV